MRLGDKQRVFTKMTAQLIQWAYANGYELTYGDAFRFPEHPYGRKTSLHKSRLAVDFNLFRHGKYLTTTEDHRPLGEYWESIGGSWGGRFNDGNHYSLAHQGRR